MCRLSVGNAVVPGGEHFPRKGAFVRLAGEKSFIMQNPTTTSYTTNSFNAAKKRIKLERGISFKRHFIGDGHRGNILS